MNGGRFYETVDPGAYEIIIFGKPKGFISRLKQRKALFGRRLLGDERPDPFLCLLWVLYG